MAEKETEDHLLKIAAIMFRITTFFLSTLLLCWGCEKKLSEQEMRHYREKGAEISGLTYQKLSGTLVEKMQAGGIPEALAYCNAAAQDMTGEMAAMHGVSIKRTALKTRNQQNTPNQEELRILRGFQDLVDKGEDPGAIVEIDRDGNPHYYAPIRLEKRCLSCHGRLGVEVSPAVDSLIRSYYPKDMAVGFEENDLRGIWSIAFINQ